MSEVVKSAGLQAALTQAQPSEASPRREAIKLIRAKLRNPQTTDDDLDDALEALVELSKD